VLEWPDPHWWEGLSFRRDAGLLGLDGVVEMVNYTRRPLEHRERFDIFGITS
jgi:hypothetical protein